jgi:iron(III) transport system substrate-binding protein
MKKASSIRASQLALALAASGFMVSTSAIAQSGEVNVICSAQAAWCSMIAVTFEKSQGIKVNMTAKGSGEAIAQLAAEKANPKTDIWWGGTGDPFLQAAEIGLLAPYRPDYLNDLHGWSVRHRGHTRTAREHAQLT